MQWTKIIIAKKSFFFFSLSASRFRIRGGYRFEGTKAAMTVRTKLEYGFNHPPHSELWLRSRASGTFVFNGSAQHP